MCQFAGIDVGQGKYFAATLDTRRKEVHFPESVLGLTQCIEWIRSRSPKQTCIDAPSGPNRSLLGSPEYRKEHGVDLAGSSGNRRIAEWRLGIGGCYATKAEVGEFPDWMKSGLALYEGLCREGFVLDLGSMNGNVFEYHPTYGFKSMLSLEIRPQVVGMGKVTCDGARHLRPKMPTGSLGHQQRVAMVKKLLSRWDIPLKPDQEQRLERSVDWTDALFGAELSLLKEEGLVFAVVDPERKEGGIWLADVDRLPGFSTELRSLVELVEDNAKSRVLPGRNRGTRRRVTQSEDEGALLRLGDCGPGGFTQQDTIDTIQSMMDSEGILILPVGIRAIDSDYRHRAETAGLPLWVGFDGTLRLCMLVNRIEGRGRDNLTTWQTVAGTDKNPWGVEAAEYWFFAQPGTVHHLQSSYQSIQTWRSKSRQWMAGVPKNRGGWLQCRSAGQAS